MTADLVELGPLVDHHCHGLTLDDLDRGSFEALLNEAAAPSPLGTSFFDSMLGLAIRRWCAPVLGLEGHVPAEDYLDRRRELGAEASRALVAAAGIETFLVDTGLRAHQLCSAADLAEMSGGTAYEVVRLEALAEDLLDAGTGPADFGDVFEAALRELSRHRRQEHCRVPDRSGPAARTPGAAELGTALADQRPAAGQRHRIAHPVINSWLAWTAVRIGLPLQFHVGYGDADLDLRRADPLRLTSFLRATERLAVPVLLLHNYPFHRNAAYLAQVYGHVFLDVGLAVHNTGALSQALIRETLETVPFGKLLFSTDAYGLAEFFFLGAMLFRRGLAAVLGELINAGEMTGSDANRTAALIARENARRVYRLSV